MNERTWISEALQLRFDKKIQLKQICRRVDVPRTTLHSLFDRFTRSGLSWPIPADISPEQLEQLLYPGKNQQYGPAPTADMPEKHRESLIELRC